jgi:hypothetical protein
MSSLIVAKCTWPSLVVKIPLVGCTNDDVTPKDINEHPRELASIR